MKTVVKAGIAAACGALIGAVGMVQSTGAQQQPPAMTTTPQPPAASTTPQTTPMQPGPGMGRHMMQSRGMMQQGTGSEGAGQTTGQQMMNMGQQMRTMGQQMMSRHAKMQEQEHMGRQMMDMGQQMENMGHQMMNEHGTMQTQPQGAAPAAPSSQVTTPK